MSDPVTPVATSATGAAPPLLNAAHLRPKNFAVALGESETLIRSWIKRGMPQTSVAAASEWREKELQRPVLFLDSFSSEVREYGSPDPGAAFLQNAGIALLDESTGPPAPPLQTLLQKDFATALAVTQQTISQYIKQGMPTRSIGAAKDWQLQRQIDAAKDWRAQCQSFFEDVDAAALLPPPPSPPPPPPPPPPALLHGSVGPRAPPLQTVAIGMQPSAAEMAQMDENIALLCLRRFTFKLQRVHPATIVKEYFDARRAMPYKGRRVIHISRTCPDLFKVRV
jgi:hypothetical protein